MKTQNSSILVVFILLFTSCIENQQNQVLTDSETSRSEKLIFDSFAESESEQSDSEIEVGLIAEMYGFKAIPLKSFEHGALPGIHLEKSELDIFFQYLSNARKDRDKIDFNRLSEIF